MRVSALLPFLAASVLWPLRATAACNDAAPCVDAEPMWLAPGSRYWSFVADRSVLGLGQVAASANVGFRLEPVVLDAPAPNAEGRVINLIRHTTDLTVGARVGIGRRMELTLSLPLGLYQRGAGIKGVTHQSASPIPEQSLHDPRVGFGYALPYRLLRHITFKVRLDLKLPLGEKEALMGERSFVASPTFLLGARQGRWFSGGELGMRLRRPTDFFGRRVASSEFCALGLGYELPRPQLAFTVEAYALLGFVPSTPRPGVVPDSLAEWLFTARYTPRSLASFSLGVAGGTGFPAPSQDGWVSGIGAPLLRVLTFARWVPPAD